MTVASSTTPETVSETDEEGLQKHYDVILCGTGLIQSILAAALARQGYSCLHLDSDDVYGALEAVWTYDKLHELQQRRWCSADPATEGAAARAAGIKVDIPLLYDHQDNGQLAGLEFHSIYPSMTNTTALTISSLVQTPMGNGRITAMDPSSIQVTLDYPPLSLPSLQPNQRIVDCESSEAPTQTAVLNTLGVLEFSLTTQVNDEAGERAPEPSLEVRLKSHHGIIPRLPQILKHTLWDLSFMAIFANGPAVHTLLESNVAEYLEFKSVEGLLWWDSAMGALVPVPCAKNQVFTSRLVASPMEKRKLMKVLSLFMDYGTTTATAPMSGQEEQPDDDPLNESAHDNHPKHDMQDEDNEVLVQSLNERHLNQGRSLARPQNKAVATIELDRLRAFLELHPNIPFEDYLSKQHSLSPKLTQIIRFALALDTNTTTSSADHEIASPSSSTSLPLHGLAKDISNLTQHLQSLGRYGSTAMLAPMYGSGELSQAFCRSAAVFGATYLLRRRPCGINVLAEEGEADGHRQPLLTVVVEGEEVKQGEHDSTPPALPSRSLSYKKIACSHVVVPRTTLASPDSTRNISPRQKRIVRRMSLLQKPLVSSEPGHESNNHPDQRHLMIFPPKTLMGQDHVIYGMTADESIQVAPKGFTILYLTTVIPPQSGDGGAKKDESTIRVTTKLLDEVAKMLLSSSSSSDNTEVYHTTFSYVALDDGEHVDADQRTSAPRADAYPTSVHLCPSLGATVTADVAFLQAQILFDQICSNNGTDPHPRSFMGLSSTLQRVLEERGRPVHESEDNEQAMLSSALGMLEHGNNADAEPDSPTIRCMTMTDAASHTMIGTSGNGEESPNENQ